MTLSKKECITHFIEWLNDYSHHRQVIHKSYKLNTVHLEEGVYIPLPEAFTPRSTKWTEYVIDQIHSENGPLYAFYLLYRDTLAARYEEYETSDSYYIPLTSGKDYVDDTLSLSTIYRNKKGQRLVVNTTGSYTEKEAAERNHELMMDIVLSNLNQELYEAGIMKTNPMLLYIKEFFVDEVTKTSTERSGYKNLLVFITHEDRLYKRTFYCNESSPELLNNYITLIIREIIAIDDKANDKLYKMVYQESLRRDKMFSFTSFLKSLFRLGGNTHG